MNPTDVSGVLQGLADADYLVADGDVGTNREAQQLIKLRQALRPHEDRLDIAWCGAAIARMLLQHPWLQRFQLELWSESVYNDEGGSFMSHYVRVHDAEAVPETALPDEVQDSEGAFSPDAAADLLESEHEDDEYDLCLPFIAQGNADSCMLKLDRDVVAPLLAGGAVSGLAVARVLWPDHESLRAFAPPLPPNLGNASASASASAESTTA